jgi:6-phosphofructokinase 1
VGGIIHLGGTFLGSSRLPEFATAAVQAQARESLAAAGVDALVVIGGNGTQKGSLALSHSGVRVVGLPSTIDNDLAGTEITIGADTAVNIALESIDRLRTTAVSHRRIVVVEVMGRDCGYLGLVTGIAGGAEAVVVPEARADLAELGDAIRRAYAVKGHALVVVAEGAALGGHALASHLASLVEPSVSVRLTVLGHVQRGGNPTAFDRLLASRLGAAATGAVAAGRFGILVGLSGGKLVESPLVEVCREPKRPDPLLPNLAEVLSL